MEGKITVWIGLDRGSDVHALNKSGGPDNLREMTIGA